jgi:hypothetical protein
MIFWFFCAFIWFKNMKKMLLQMTSGFLQLESTINNRRVRGATLEQTWFIYRQQFPSKIGQVFSCVDFKIARARGYI